MPTSSNDVTYVAPFTGGVSRILTTKLAEYVTPGDFGAVGDGSADDTAAVQAALDSGKDVLLVARYLVSDTINVNTRGQRIFGLMGPGTTSRAAIMMSTGSTAPIVLNIRAHAVCLENFIVIGRSQLEADTLVIFAEEDYQVTPDGKNNGDVDLKITNCAIGRGETLIRIKGRGLNVTQCNLVSFTHGIEIDWPDEQDPEDAEDPDPAKFNPGPNFDNKLLGGMRAYMIRDNRFHAGSGGYLVRNIGWNKANIHGIQFIGNYIDTNCRIFEGTANESIFSDNILIHSVAPNFLFSVSGGDNVRIADNMFYGMVDNGEGQTREILGGVLLSGVSNVSIDGNHFKRVTRDVLSLGTGCTNVAFRGNVMKDVCLANDVSTESQRYVVRINDPVDGLIISENMVDNPSMLRNPPMIGLATTSAAVSGLVVRDNILPDGISTHELTTAMRQAVTDTSRAVLAYDGDGTASQTLTLRFAPVFVMVSITTGTDRGRSMSVSAMASAGSDLVEISGRDVIVKGAWNATATSYTVFAVT
ncbi:hypothetical protein GCM10011505_04440 [Tistrella bauzanensis]|uniref:Pectate lyase superfamily protein domain-containing protein n=1 Tax=Tistrella bauzanensis TaxID=657419 RepID=A0ABQ1I9B5_9PROT|nr:hypothetical protein [Tistrella bauzanensis]GGB26337.1 hypothetical protein GCM10011505_04440 [Tistrella bauzanensis]